MSLIQTFPDGGGGGLPNGSTVTPTDDVQTWLACAGLHQSYTTLNEVLADNSVLSALMASTNAVDYLVRSTTWAATICADETAMNCIGVNDYCADILLADSTWRTAICNSTYFEEVLNVKVPTMTSNTTPYGIVTCNSELSGYEGYKVFGEDYQTTRWVSQVSTNGYVQYEFTQDVSIKLMKLRVNLTGNDQYRRCKDFKIQVGNDATDLYSNTAALSSSIQTFIIPNPNKYKKYRFLVLNTDAGTIAVDDLQLYGRGKSPIVDTKADISAIAPEEAGSTSSRSYAVGDNFYKNGKFCTCTQAIAQGAQFTLGTNYVEGTVADILNEIDIPFTVGPDFELSTGVNNRITKLVGDFYIISLNIKVKNNISASSNPVILSFNDTSVRFEPFSYLTMNNNGERLNIQHGGHNYIIYAWAYDSLTAGKWFICYVIAKRTA